MKASNISYLRLQVPKEEETLYYFESMPGYYVASTDVPTKDPGDEDPRMVLISHLLMSLPHALVLKHNCGDMKVLVPFRIPVRSLVASAPVSNIMTFLPTTHKDAPKSRKVFFYDVHPTGQFLIPGDTASLLYLLLCHLNSRQYA